MRLLMMGLTTSVQSESGATGPKSIGPGLSPSSSYKRPSMGIYPTKWKTSSLFVVIELSNSNKVCLAKELCTALITGELLIVRPFIFASKPWQKSLSSVRAVPNFKSECRQFNRTLRIACVAHAFSITCFAKKILSNLLSCTTEPAHSSSFAHLNKNIRPWIGLKQNNH